jgi:hypothetical protein
MNNFFADDTGYMLVDTASMKIRLWNEMEMIRIEDRSRLSLLTPELNPSAQRCVPRFFIGDFNF